MQPQSLLSLFGPVRLGPAGDGIPGLRSRKAVAILAYVAAQEKPLPRSHLADLFWPADSAERGHANLRWALSHLNTALPGCLTISRHSVTWGETLTCDLHCFSQLLRQNSSASLSAAVDLYQGELLAGFVLDGCAEFELWLTAERQRRQQQVIQALRTLSRQDEAQQNEAQQNEAQQNVTTALDYTQRWLALTPWDEEAHRQVIELLAISGQRSAALHQYEICRQTLQMELGVEPSPETNELYEKIRNGTHILDRVTGWQAEGGIDTTNPTPAPSHPLIPSPHNLPRQLTPFIGRTEELARIEALLSDPTCAWLTLLGPGGVGKTRLALAAARQLLPYFADGVWFVALAEITTVEHLPTTVAQALGLALLPGDVDTQLRTHLRNRNCLLVLDNFEDLLAGVDWLAWLIEQAPGVKVLVTSRQRLDHQAEWLLDVGGLATAALATEAASSNSAVQLFVQCARRVRTTFTPTAADIGLISQICRAVDGMPLGIELAASWVRALPLSAILAEVSHNLDFGTLATHGIPDRHRSLRTVIDSSWRRLTAPEQALLARLSVFRGGADWTAAAQVAGATPLLLTRLADKSLLYSDGAGRYLLHELVRQFAAEQLQCLQLAEETSAAHSRYYSTLLAEQVDALISDHPQTTLQRWDAELDNLRAAWQWAVRRADADTIQQMVQPLNLYYDYRTRLQEARQSFQQAVEALQLAQPTPAREIARGMALARCALLLWRSGEEALAEQFLQESRAIAHRHALVSEEAYATYVLGYLCAGLERTSEAEVYLQQALALAEVVNDHNVLVRILYAMGWNYHQAGASEASFATLRRSLQLARNLGDLRSIAHVLCYLGATHLAVKAYGEARQCQQESLALFQSIGVQWGVAQAQFGLLQVAFAEGDREEVKRLSAITISLYEQTGIQWKNLAGIRRMAEQAGAG